MNSACPGGRYCDHYPGAALQSWAHDIRRWRRQRRDAYCFFDNDRKSAAPRMPSGGSNWLRRTAGVPA